jgi:hypothetical protein
MNLLEKYLSKIKPDELRDTIPEPKKYAVLIWSEILQAHLWIVADDEHMRELRDDSARESIYKRDEIMRLKGMNKDDLKRIHEVKELFSEASINSMKKQDDTTETIDRDAQEQHTSPECDTCGTGINYKMKYNRNTEKLEKKCLINNEWCFKVINLGYPPLSDMNNNEQ